ncbi:MAG: amidohydrolase family protein [Phycisphaerae bacterium]|nr:amidohydrolase family protein [Phycisphaerae bacterium]
MIAVAVLAFAIAPSARAQTVLLEGAAIVPVVGNPIKKGSILIKDGRIAAIGQTVEAPFDAKVIDCGGRTLFPGMVDVHTSRGIDVPNESPPVTPYLNVYDAIDPSQLFYEDSLRDGVTSIHVIHGNDCVIGGMSRVVHPIGMTPEQMTTLPDAAMKLSLSPKGGYDRMLQLATLREAFAKLDEDMKKLAEQRYEARLREEGKDLDVPPEEEQKRGKELIREEDIDEKNRNLLLLTQGRIRAFIYCGNAMDVAPAVRIARSHGFVDQAVLVLGSECFKAVSELKKAGLPVVLDSTLVHIETDPITGEEKETFVPKVISKAGLKFALQRKTGSSLGERYLWFQAARCIREGISRDDALKSITLWPAEMLGLGDRLGSLEVGKEANILVLTGDPLDAQTWVEKVFIQGEQVYERADDIRLRELFSTPAEEAGPSSSTEPVPTTTKADESSEEREMRTPSEDRPRGERRPRGDGPPRRRGPRPPSPSGDKVE